MVRPAGTFQSDKRIKALPSQDIDTVKTNVETTKRYKNLRNNIEEEYKQQHPTDTDTAGFGTRPV